MFQFVGAGLQLVGGLVGAFVFVVEEGAEAGGQWSACSDLGDHHVIDVPTGLGFPYRVRFRLASTVNRGPHGFRFGPGELVAELQVG